MLKESFKPVKLLMRSTAALEKAVPQSELQHLKHMFWQHIRCICPHLVAKESSGIYRNNWQTPMDTQDTSDQWELVKFNVDLGLSTGFTANPNTSIT